MKNYDSMFHLFTFHFLNKIKHRYKESLFYNCGLLQLLESAGDKEWGMRSKTAIYGILIKQKKRSLEEESLDQQ